MMVPTKSTFQDNIFMLVYPTLCINIEKCMLFVSLFRMRTVDDLRNQLQMFKHDIDDHYKLLVPEIRNGLVLYINTDLANLKMQKTVSLISKLVSTGNTNLKALSNSITRLELYVD